MKQLTGIVVLIIGIAFLFGFGYAMPVHAQFTNEPFFLKEIPDFSLANDSLIKRISPSTDFSYALQVFREDIHEAFTFNPEQKAELKLKHAQEEQERINLLDISGNQIPLQHEERRIQKLNEAKEIIQQKFESEGTYQDRERITDTWDLLREMGELNDIRILYSQLPRVINADDDTKREYNEKVNSLDTWKNNCTGSFDVDDMKPLRKAVQKLEAQCPKLVVLQDKFGYERMKILVTGEV